MCDINWTLIASMLGGVGAFLTGIAAIFIIPWQLGFRKDAQESKKELNELKTSLKLMRSIYKQYMASSEGIVWENYPGDSEKIINAISKRTGFDTELVRQMLDTLKNEGKI